MALSPLLEAGLSRIIMTWATDIPRDLDLHVMAIKRSDGNLCRTYYANKNGCPSIALALDNTAGGLNGAETVTLEDNSVNSLYTYLVAIKDYRFENNGASFPQSKAHVSITNGLQTKGIGINEASLETGRRFYFFGCLEVPNPTTIQFKPAPEGTIFNGESDDQWPAMALLCSSEDLAP